MAFGQASASTLAHLRLRYGSQIRARSKIKNARVLIADLSGPCGERVIKTVNIGTGMRELDYRREAAGDTGVAIAGVGIAAGARDWQHTGERLAWDDEQAWGFTVGGVAGAERIRLGIDMPTELTDGDEYTIQVSAARQVWIVALYEEAGGGVGILLPNGENPSVVVAAGQRRPLPAMRVSLRDPALEAREKIVIYGFTEQEDYEDFRPPAGALSEAAANEYHEALPERLRALPSKRWTRAEISYIIKPRASE